MDLAQSWPVRPNVRRLAGRPTARRAMAFGLACWSLLASGPVCALPIAVAWDVPLIHAESYQFELADTPGFSHTLVSTIVKGTGYVGEVTTEGVYHWRLQRPGNKSGDTAGQEVSALASGSFVVLDPDVKRLSAPRLTWDKVEGAERYKIYILGANASQRIMTVSTNSFMLPKVDEPMMLEVVPYTEGHRSTRAYHMDPSLTLVSGAPVASATSAAAVPAGADKAVSKTVDFVDEQRRRSHIVYLFAEGLEETIKVQKLALNLNSTTRQAGGGAGFWTNPAYGLVLSGQAEYHEHQDKNVTQPALFPGQKLEVNQSRFSADFSIGYNLLDLFKIRRVLFSVAGTAGLTQLPLVPEDLAVTPPAPPPLNKERLSLLGGSASLGYLGTYTSVLIEGGGMSESKTKGHLIYERLLLEFYPSASVAIQVGAFHRDTSGSKCAASAAQCLTVGTSSTTVTETGVTLGLGVVAL